MVTNFLLVFGIIMMISGVFSYKQLKVTSDVYSDMKKKGTLLIGEKRFCIFFISEVVAFSIGADGRIKSAVKISGMLPFRKVKEYELPDYIGKKFRSMDPYQRGVDSATAKIVTRMIKRHAKAYS